MIGRHLGQPGAGAVHFVAELPGQDRLVLAIRHAGNRVGAGQHVADGGLVVFLDLRVGVELGAFLAAMGRVGADAAQVIARLGREVEDHAHAVLVGQRKEAVHDLERLLVELPGALHVVPGHTSVRGFVLGIADRQVPQPHHAEVHLVERLEAVLLLPRRRQVHPLRQVQRPVIRQNQARHVGADEAELLVAVHQLLALPGDEVGKRHPVDVRGRRWAGTRGDVLSERHPEPCQQHGDGPDLRGRYLSFRDFLSCWFGVS